MGAQTRPGRARPVLNKMKPQGAKIASFPLLSSLWAAMLGAMQTEENPSMW